MNASYGNFNTSGVSCRSSFKNKTKLRKIFINENPCTATE